MARYLAARGYAVIEEDALVERLRQIVEVVHGKWTEVFRLDEERPHTFAGFQARLAALMALHNACIWINRSLGRAPLAFADLVDW